MIANDINNTLVDVGDITLKFTNSSALDLIKTGDVIYSLSTEKFPDGYAYKILSRENVGGQIICNYEPATMDEVFVKFNETIDVQPNMSKEGVRVYDILPNTTKGIKNTNKSIFNPIGFDSEKFKGVKFGPNTVELTYILWDNDKDYKKTEYDQITAIVKLEADYSSVDAVFENGVFAVWGYPTIGISCKLVTGGNEADADLQKKLSEKLKMELVGKKLPLLSFDLTSLSVSSLAIKPTVDVYALIELNAEGKLIVNLSYDNTRVYFKAQNYKTSPNDDKLICEVQKWGTPDFGIEAKLEANVTLGLGIGLVFKFPAFEYKKGEKSYFGIFSDVSYEGQVIAKGGWSINEGMQCKDYGFSLKPYWKTYGEARLGIFKNKLLSIDINPDALKQEISILDKIEKSYNYCEDTPAIPTDGLVAYYPFNGNTNDESGNGNNGIANGATLTTDRKGIVNNAAYRFNGIDNYIRVENSSSLSFNKASSWSFWFRSTANNGTPYCIFAKNHDQEGLLNSFISFNNDNTINFWVSYISPSVSIITAEKSNWNHFVTTFDEQNSRIKFYCNGILVNEQNVSFSHQPSNGKELMIGKMTQFIGYNWASDGDIDDFRVYNRILTDTEVLALKNE